MWAKRRTHLVFGCQNINNNNNCRAKNLMYLVRGWGTQQINHQQIDRCSMERHTHDTHTSNEQTLFNLNRIHLQIDWYFTTCRICQEFSASSSVFKDRTWMLWIAAWNSSVYRVSLKPSGLKDFIFKILWCVVFDNFCVIWHRSKWI